MNPMINNGISSVSMVLGLMSDLKGTAFVLHRMVATLFYCKANAINGVPVKNEIPATRRWEIIRIR